MKTPEQVIRTREELQAILGEPGVNQLNKCIDHIDQGDPPGFVTVLDEDTLGGREIAEPTPS